LPLAVNQGEIIKHKMQDIAGTIGIYHFSGGYQIHINTKNIKQKGFFGILGYLLFLLRSFEAVKDVTISSSYASSYTGN
jgi:hypothetical protein